MALLHSKSRRRPWLDGDVPFVSAREGLSIFREPPGFLPLADSARAIFLTSIDEMAKRHSE